MTRLSLWMDVVAVTSGLLVRTTDSIDQGDQAFDLCALCGRELIASLFQPAGQCS